MVMNLLKSLNSWLLDQSGDEISYEALEKIIDNRAQVSPDRVWTFLLITEYHLSREHNQHPDASMNWARSRTVQGHLIPWLRSQCKTTSGTLELSEIIHYLQYRIIPKL